VAEDIDLSAFEGSNRPGPRCMVSVAIEDLTPDQRAKVLAAFEATHIKTVMIAEILGEWSGKKIGYSTVQRHRRKQCAC
jgi:hypothetical protein